MESCPLAPLRGPGRGPLVLCHPFWHRVSLRVFLLENDGEDQPVHTFQDWLLLRKGRDRYNSSFSVILAIGGGVGLPGVKGREQKLTAKFLLYHTGSNELETNKRRETVASCIGVSGFYCCPWLLIKLPANQTPGGSSADDSRLWVPCTHMGDPD